jgi:DNA-binding response OmpR family regulator
MLRKILIVDDDRILRNLIQKKCKKYENIFTPFLAGDGGEALEILKVHSVSLVVTDLQMPNMDGFALIAQLSKTYPDIPVIVLTGFRAPEWKKQKLKESAAGYIEKPFVVEELVETIKNFIEKESEGGLLHSIPLEMFVQLIELDSRTCTVRVADNRSGKEGGLFFRDGVLLDARVGETHGTQAAYEIFSWGKVVIFLQDSCTIQEQTVQEDLGAIILEAMRLKDEMANG